MDIESLKQALSLGNAAIQTLKGIKDMLPSSKDRERLEHQLADAEKAFKIAEASAAKDLGYPLCKCTWPPQIMLTEGDSHHFKCLSCGYKLDTTPVMPSFVAGRRNWRGLDG